jgi:hypothetical protein
LGPGPAPINAAGGYHYPQQQQQQFGYQQHQPYQQQEDIYYQQHRGQYNPMPNQQYANVPYGTLPSPELGDNRPRVQEVETNIRMSICCCITWILLLALTAIPCGLCAFFCSLYSISLRKKGDTERANKRGSNAMCAIITSVPIGCLWAFIMAFGVIFLIFFFIGLFEGSSSPNY